MHLWINIFLLYLNYIYNVFYADGIMGEVLFWTLHKCLGPDVFNDNIHLIWVKILSRILKHMVPVAVAFELDTKSVNQNARIDTISLFQETKEHVNKTTSDETSVSYGEMDRRADELEKKYNDLKL